MPIIEDAPASPSSPKPTPIRVSSNAYQGVATDTRFTPVKSLITHVEGSSWTVEYYSQVLARDNAVSGQNLDRDAVFQQYRHIKNLELKVTQPLTQPNQDSNSKSMALTGQANFYPCGVIPNDNDIFVAELADGRRGLFTLTLSEQRSIYADAGWIVDYTMVGYATDDKLADLKTKTVEDLVYVADFLLYGQNPLISTNEFDQLRQLDAMHDEIVQDYFRRFVSNEYRTLLLPGQTFPIYDPFLTKAILSIFGSENSSLLKNVRELNVSDDDNFKVPTIWDVLVNKKPSRLKNSPMKMGLVTAAAFSRDPAMDSIRYSGVKYVVYPADPERSEDDLRIAKQKPLSDWVVKSTSTRVTDLSKLITIADLPGLPQRDLPSINRNNNEFYVLSEAFYRGLDNGVSAMEVQVRRYLSDRAIDIPALVTMAQTYNSWGPLDQFYQIPILLILIRATIRRM
jgi:hypothetical protein